MADEKQLPSTEYSLKSISWHLKTATEELKNLNAILVKMMELEKAKSTKNEFNY